MFVLNVLPLTLLKLIKILTLVSLRVLPLVIFYLEVLVMEQINVIYVQLQFPIVLNVQMLIYVPNVMLVFLSNKIHLPIPVNHLVQLEHIKMEVQEMAQIHVYYVQTLFQIVPNVAMLIPVLNVDLHTISKGIQALILVLVLVQKIIINLVRVLTVPILVSNVPLIA